MRMESLKKLKAFYWPYKKLFVWSLFSMLLLTAITVVYPIMLQMTIDEVILLPLWLSDLDQPWLYCRDGGKGRCDVFSPISRRYVRHSISIPFAKRAVCKASEAAVFVL